MTLLLLTWAAHRLGECAHTMRSLTRAVWDAILLVVPRRLIFHIPTRHQRFAFMVHPRSAEFHVPDVYGQNDIFRPFPALRWFTFLVEPERATRWILTFARWIIPTTLSRIVVRLNDGTTCRGYLLTTVRTPQQLLGSDAKDTRRHLGQLFELAARKGVQRVGLGALLPAMTSYGKKFADASQTARPSVSTGHGYTAYVITEYLKVLITRRNPGAPVVRVAVMGAAGSTGKATLRMLKRTWGIHMTRLELVLVDLPMKEFALRRLSVELTESRQFSAVRTATDPMALRECSYVVVVTNAAESVVRPEHLSPETVLIDDSQPRNTSEELVHYGHKVLDVLARVPGLDCRFDFGFRTKDRSVTFTCLAETVIAAAVGEKGDLAVGEVTDAVVDRVLEMVPKARALGLIGDLVFFSFGREMMQVEVLDLLTPIMRRPPIAAE